MKCLLSIAKAAPTVSARAGVGGAESSYIPDPLSHPLPPPPSPPSVRAKLQPLGQQETPFSKTQTPITYRAVCSLLAGRRNLQHFCICGTGGNANPRSGILSPTSLSPHRDSDGPRLSVFAPPSTYSMVPHLSNTLYMAVALIFFPWSAHSLCDSFILFPLQLSETSPSTQEAEHCNTCSWPRYSGTGEMIRGETLDRFCSFVLPAACSYPLPLQPVY